MIGKLHHCSTPKLTSRLARREMGNALIELALIMPVLILLVLGAFDFSRVFYTAIAVTAAAHAGAQYGAQSLAKSGDTAGMVQVAQTAADELEITATAAQVCRCATGTATVACTTTSGGCVPLRIYARVTATHTFSTVTNYPGIPNSFTISRTAQIRAQ